MKSQTSTKKVVRKKIKAWAFFSDEGSIPDPLEHLPIKIIKDGKEFWLRIKPRNGTGKKWCIRYVGRKEGSPYTMQAVIRGYTYTTAYQFWGNNLQNVARKALRELSKTSINNSLTEPTQ